jgi:NodT family efflux transporter outer membrane factor (OMF) lipoprotein
MSSHFFSIRYKTKAFKSFSYLFITLLAGCAVGPDYKKPDVSLPTEFKQASGWKQATPSDDAPRGSWWEVYHDPILNDLELSVAKQNQSLQALAYNYEQSRQIVRSDFTTLLPFGGFSASSNHTKSPITKSSQGNISSSSTGLLTASWSPDFWGKIRRLTESDTAASQVSAANYANAKLSIEATLAQDYIQLRILDEKKRLIDKAVEAYNKTLLISQNKYTVGVAARRDVISSQAQRDAARAQSIDVGVQRTQIEHAIAVLIGKSPEELSIEVKPSLDLSLPTIPYAVPASLLERRPDVAAAERYMAEQNAKIGIQTAAYFPSITLTGSTGYQGTPISNLISSPFKLWSLGVNATDTILDYGERHDLVLATSAGYNASVASYRQTVLSAIQQVDDQLSNLSILELESSIQGEAVKEAAEAARIAQNEYAAGTVDYTTVVLAEVTELNDRESSLAILQNRLNASIKLIEGLGGGWNNTQLPTTSQTLFHTLEDNQSKR